MRAAGTQVVAIRIAVLLKADSEFHELTPSFVSTIKTKWAFQPQEKALFKTIWNNYPLKKNVKNFGQENWII